MSVEANKQLYRRWLLELWNGKLAITDQIVTPDFVGSWPGRPGLVHGPKELAEIIRMTAYSVDQDSKAIEELEKKHGVKLGFMGFFVKACVQALKDIPAVNAEIDGERLTEREFDTMFLLLVVAGNETTRQAIAHGMLALAENRDQWQRLTDDPELVWTAGADEILRWSSPVLHFRRTATRDVEVGGQTIRAGDKVVIWYVSANFDEEVFADPLRFDVGRRPNPHVTFGGGGPHFCLGAQLARLEIRVLFEELAARVPRLEALGAPDRLRSNFINGIKHMPVRVELAGQRP
jgi:hypothetical protein